MRLILGTCLALVGCVGASRLVGGDACDPECVAGELCVAGSCQAACNDDGDCRETELCDQGACAARLSSENPDDADLDGIDGDARCDVPADCPPLEDASPTCVDVLCVDSVCQYVAAEGRA